MKIQDLLKDLKSIEVLEGDAVAKHLRERQTGVPDARFIQRDDGRVELIKSTTSGFVTKGVQGIGLEQAQALAAQRGVTWRAEYADRVKLQWGSDQRVDRHGDIVLQDWDFTEFARNPVMPFNHNWDSLPVGVHLDWLVTNRVDRGYNGPALLLTSLYAAADEMPPGMGDSLFRLISAGMLRANSVGFIPGKIIQITDEAERERLGLGRWGDVLANNLLLENSPTLLGANQGAMTILNSAKSSGQLQAADMLMLRELTRQVKHDTPDDWKSEDEKWRQMARMLFPTEEFAKAEDVDQPFVEVKAEAEPETEAVDESLVIEVSATPEEAEQKASGEEMILAKLQQLIGLVEMLALSVQTQLDSIADALVDGESELNTLKAQIEELKKLKNPQEPSLAEYLATLVPSS